MMTGYKNGYNPRNGVFGTSILYIINQAAPGEGAPLRIHRADVVLKVGP